MEFYKNIIYVILAVLKLSFIYWMWIILISLSKRPSEKPAQGFVRFAVLIPAMNEEAVIASTVKSILAQDYPHEFYDVIVIPNNCNDGTEAAALKAGAGIMECRSEVHCKGDVLHYAMEQLLAQGDRYDAICVFDADNIVEMSFLSEINRAFANGAKIAKGRSMTGNSKSSFCAASYEVYYDIIHFLYNMPRLRAGLSARLNGTGFAVSMEFIRSIGGWNTVTMAEDAEFAVQCAMVGERVVYVPAAVCYDEAPMTWRDSFRQRSRWAAGVTQVAALKLNNLAASYIKNGNPLVFDLFIFIATPLNQSLSLFFGIVSFAFAAACSISELAAMIASALITSACCVLFALLLETVFMKRGLSAARGVAAFPVFTVSFVLLAAFAIVHKPRKWEKAVRIGGNKVPAAME